MKERLTDAGPRLPDETQVAREFLISAARALPQDSSRKYMALADSIEQGVKSGALAPGTQLPPQRDIATVFGTTIATVTKAMSEAARRGLVAGRAGTGTFISPSRQNFQDTDVLDLSLSVPPAYVTASIVFDALKTSVQTCDPADVFDYSALPGSDRSRRAGAAWLSLRQVEVDPGFVAVTHGAHEGLIVSLLAVTKPGDSVLCERFNYAGLKRISHMLQLKLVGVDIDSDGMKTEALDDLIKRHDAKVIVCTPSCQNPTATTLPATRRNELVICAKRNLIPIIEDDVFGPMADPALPPMKVLWPEGVFLVSSLSKTIAPGLRIGYVAHPSNAGARIVDAMFKLSWAEPTLQALVASQLILSGGARECVERHRAEAMKRVALARDYLGPALISAPESSYHLWVSTGELEASNVVTELSRRGILVSPGANFVTDESSAPNTMRICIGGSLTHDQLKQSLRGLSEVLTQGRSTSLGSIV